MNAEETVLFLRDCQRTHKEWAEYFESNPEVEKEMVSGGQWEGAAAHRNLEQKYEETVQLINTIEQRTREAIRDALLERAKHQGSGAVRYAYKTASEIAMTAKVEK